MLIFWLHLWSLQIALFSQVICYQNVVIWIKVQYPTTSWVIFWHDANLVTQFLGKLTGLHGLKFIFKPGLFELRGSSYENSMLEEVLKWQKIDGSLVSPMVFLLEEYKLTSRHSVNIIGIWNSVLPGLVIIHIIGLLRLLR